MKTQSGVGGEIMEKRLSLYFFMLHINDKHGFYRNVQDCSHRKSVDSRNQTYVHSALRKIKLQKWLQKEIGEAGRQGTN